MKRFAVPMAAAALILAAACGGGSETEVTESATPTASKSRSPAASPSAPAATPTATPAVQETGSAPAQETAPPGQTEAPQSTLPPTAPPAGNSDPGFPGETVTSTETQFEYDDDGLLTGAVTTLSIPAASDPDGDPLTYSWAASSGSISGSGLSATWTRSIEYGDVAPGTVTATASDGRGGIATFIIEFQ